MVTGLALLLMPGCGLLGGGNYLDRELACGSDPHDWWGSLTRYVDQGNGEGGFNLEEVNEQYLDLVQGKYDLDTGELAFSREYSDQHYLVQEIGRGYGIVDRNGDLDVIYKLDHEDVLGETWTTELHEVREGCYGSITEFYSDVEGDEATVEYRMVADDEVKIHYVTVVGQDEETTDGSDFADGTGTRVRVYESDGYGYEYDRSLLVSGGYNEDWTYNDYSRDWTYVGQNVGQVDGSRVQDYVQSDADDGDELATYHEEREYGGSGAGTYTYSGGTTCDYDFRDWYSCSCTCSNNADCSC